MTTLVALRPTAALARLCDALPDIIARTGPPPVQLIARLRRQLLTGRAWMFASGDDMAVLELIAPDTVMLELAHSTRPGMLGRCLGALDEVVRAAGATRVLARPLTPSRARLYARVGFRPVAWHTQSDTLVRTVGEAS